MTRPDGEKSGWSWFETDQNSAGGTPNNAERPGETGHEDSSTATGGNDLARLFGRCFRGPDGEKVMAHLRSLTLERSLGPAVPDACLRHLEGQRQLIVYIASLIERAKG